MEIDIISSVLRNEGISMNKIHFNKEFLSKLKERRDIIVIAAYAIIALIVAIVAALILQEPVVAVCVLIIIETAIAVMLHRVELWVHGAFLLAEIIAGVLMDRVILIVLCALIYAAATVSLRFINIGEKANG